MRSHHLWARSGGPVRGQPRINEGCPSPEGGKGGLQRISRGRRRSGRGPHARDAEGNPPRRRWRSLARISEGRGRRWPRGRPAAAQRERSQPPVPPVGAPAPGYLSVGPMQAVSVLSISRRIRSCSAAVSRLSASAILPRSINWRRLQRVRSFGPAHLSLPRTPQVPSLASPDTRRTTPPSVSARPLCHPDCLRYAQCPLGLVVVRALMGRVPLIYSLSPYVRVDRPAVSQEQVTTLLLCNTGNGDQVRQWH